MDQMQVERDSQMADVQAPTRGNTRLACILNRELSEGTISARDYGDCMEVERDSRELEGPGNCRVREEVCRGKRRWLVVFDGSANESSPEQAWWLRSALGRIVASQEEQKWRHDLETWPLAFREALEPYIENIDAYGNISAPDMWSGSGNININAERSRGGPWHDSEWGNVFSSYRFDVKRGWKKYGIESAKDKGRTRLLLFLWLHGIRRIDRAALRPLAEKSLGDWRAQLLKELSVIEHKLNAAKARLDRGTLSSGSRIGQAYSARTVHWLQGRISNLAQQRQRLNENLEHCVRGLSDPLQHYLAGAARPRTSRAGRPDREETEAKAA